MLIPNIFSLQKRIVEQLIRKKGAHTKKYPKIGAFFIIFREVITWVTFSPLLYDKQRNLALEILSLFYGHYRLPQIILV